MRYDDVLIENGVVAEVKIVNDQVDSLKVDSNGDGTPDTVIPPSRVITDPQNDDLTSPEITLMWNRPFNATSAAVVLSDLGSGPQRSFYRVCYSGQCSGSFQEVIYAGKYSVLFSPFASGIEVVSEDIAGNRSDVTFFNRP